METERVPLETEAGLLEHEARRWGLPLREIYHCGLRFYKEKEGKALHLSYEERLRLVALTQQAAHGPLDATAPPPGVLDVIGRDRRAARLALADMSRVQAMAAFLHTLERLCPTFKSYTEAVLRDAEEQKSQEVRREATELSQRELQSRLQEEKDKELAPTSDEQQVRRIKEALNAQTYEQFVEYAEQQCPGNFEQQAVLVRQLQDQHYHQYVTQLALDTRLRRAHVATDISTARDCTDKFIQTTENEEEMEHKEMCEVSKDEQEHSDGDDDGFPAVCEARMWTRPAAAAAEFKASVRAAGGGGVLTVGHGETLTVRVPTHRAGRCLFWEFATDGFDIGFGVYFEWSEPSTCEVTVHVADSDEDEDDDEDYTGEEVVGGGDVECGGAAVGAGAGETAIATSAVAALKPPVSLVVPIYRRDCHLEVYAGSHTYPGEGVYLLKFDNTYSLWRSKTLYYKVYYTH